MSSLKLYLIKLGNGGISDIVACRELIHLQNQVLESEINNIINIIHCAFVKPTIEVNGDIIENFRSKVLLSASLKWSLPEAFKVSKYPQCSILINKMPTPCYVALNGWGYEVEDHSLLENNKVLEVLADSEMIGSNEKFLTIAEAAEMVINMAGRPLSKEEIYARIVENELFQFGAKKPVSVLAVELDRHCDGGRYGRAVKAPLFGKTISGLFYNLKDGVIKQEGWLQYLEMEHIALYERIIKYKVTSDDDYLGIRTFLEERVRKEIDLIRYAKLKEDVGVNNLRNLLKIMPSCVLDTNIESAGFPERVKNVFLQNGLKKIEDVSIFSEAQLAKLPNLGSKSIRDIYTVISEKANKLFEINGIEDNSKSAKMQNMGTNKGSLLRHLQGTLSSFNDADRFILRSRLGYHGKEQTLQEIADKLDITRERVRQKQNKCIEEIIAKEAWDNEMGIRIGQLLVNRREPLILELLEIEDAWFEGFIGKYEYLANVIQMFSENAIHVIRVAGRRVITRISQFNWDNLIRELKSHLKDKAEEGTWTRKDVTLLYESRLANFSARELTPLLSQYFDEYMQFDSASEDGYLIAFGKTAESAVEAVLHQAEGPLHFEEVAKRASEILGKEVDPRRAHAALSSLGAKLFDRGTYGLDIHNKLSASACDDILTKVKNMLYAGPINKQWHSKEIIDTLKQDFVNIPEDLDAYILGMILENSKSFVYLGRMVWARSDSGLERGDRVEVAEAFIKILEKTGHPLKGHELKGRLAAIRGVSEDMQIHETGRLVAVGPNLWGLSDWKVE